MGGGGGEGEGVGGGVGGGGGWEEGWEEEWWEEGWEKERDRCTVILPGETHPLTSYDPLYGLLKVCKLYVSCEVPRCNQCCLIAHIGHVGSGEARGPGGQLPGQLPQVQLRLDGLQVYFEDGRPGGRIRGWNGAPEVLCLQNKPRLAADLPLMSGGGR